ncbi:hypothetical protein EYZ11_008656 [Aspergillus tanneri]|uniref:Heterokaryon incompatibility domain-containing protein n=1 Tax=Aspergillus tanneri TaxID=1220188 RepID=A0A4S3J9X3_9EURO|nr:uncharacterized protein ATNIH1004_005913 [Aspergillus tanneri]KAA8647223.1 hypothetical protein ATNIH1004_005913 [Aspergillus tanneri]THC91879.1 hypothetical protein EYZ11_008656 [Aspergillus tanneri]
MLQALLTFGLVEAVTEAKVAESTLLRTVTSSENPKKTRIVITSTNIPALLDNWRSRIRALGDSDQARQWASRVQTALKQALALLEIEVMHPRLSVFRTARLDECDYAQVLMQIGSLAEMLVSSSYVFPVKTPRQGFSWTFLLTPHRVIRDDMLLKGWCPFTIKMLSQTVKMLAYASVCPPVVRESSRGHGQCSGKGCVVNNISDPGNYEPRHVVGRCVCEKLAAGDKVINLLLKGKVPVIERNPATQNRLCAVDAASTNYVAISHVWADGLGSTAEVGIPSCQIDRLMSMTQKIVPSGTFWLDSLCVPERKDMRKKAIGLMAQTYRNAAAVLVLDLAIQSTSLSMPRELKLLRILSSGWMQRLWTLQEGILANEVIFALTDGLVTLAELIPSGQDLFNGVVADLASEVFRLQKYKQRVLTISDISAALRWRMTSKSEDEVLAISGLLNVDAYTLAGLSAEKRMSTFLLEVRQLPYNIIFLSGAKLNEPAFHWAPTTFMRAVETTLSFGLGQVICTATGLLAEYPAIYFPSTTVDSQPNWFIRDSANERIYKLIDLYLGKDAEVIGVPSSYRCNVVLLLEVPGSYQTTYGAAVWGNSEPSADVEDEENRIVCEFQKRIVFQHITESELDGETSPLIVQGKFRRMKVKII